MDLEIDQQGNNFKVALKTFCHYLNDLVLRLVEGNSMLIAPLKTKETEATMLRK